MQLQPIIKARLSKYKEDYDLHASSESEVFERFVNQMILTSHQPDAFSAESDLLDTVCVGGGNDMGIDGICIKINGRFVHTEQEVKDVFSAKNILFNIEYIFIQSKYRSKFDFGEYLKFTSGVCDFMNDSHNQPHNEDIDSWLKIKEYLNRSDNIRRWNGNPSVYLYYVAMGTWDSSLHPHIIAQSQATRDQIARSTFIQNIFFNYVDSSQLLKICEENDGFLSVVLNTIELLSLTAVENVENSSVVLCSGAEIISLITSENGYIRPGLFNSNVRDYQGNTEINKEILTTIKDSPSSFVLLNNGITIVCNQMFLANRKITIRNPQIVNGCQTCNVIYLAHKENYDLEKLSVIVKVIATLDDTVTNNIVRGTNRQNIVDPDAFEIMRDFHKRLERHFETLSNEYDNLKLYYERRSNQYDRNSEITPLQKVSYHTIFQSMVSVFLNAPHKGYSTEAKLREEYGNKLFVDSQSYTPYYVASAIFSTVDRSCRSRHHHRRVPPGSIEEFKMHIAWVFKELVGGPSPDINKEKEIDKYCENIIVILRDPIAKEDHFRKSCIILSTIRREWLTKRRGYNSRGDIIDPNFTTYAINWLAQNKNNYEQHEGSVASRGTVIKVGLNRNDEHYGFIKREPDNIYFSAKDNPNLDFSNLYAKEVLYYRIVDDYGNERAINVILKGAEN